LPSACWDSPTGSSTTSASRDAAPGYFRSRRRATARVAWLGVAARCPGLLGIVPLAFVAARHWPRECPGRSRKRSTGGGAPWRLHSGAVAPWSDPHSPWALAAAVVTSSVVVGPLPASLPLSWQERRWAGSGCVLRLPNERARRSAGRFRRRRGRHGSRLAGDAGIGRSARDRLSRRGSSSRSGAVRCGIGLLRAVAVGRSRGRAEGCGARAGPRWRPSRAAGQ